MEKELKLTPEEEKRHGQLMTDLLRAQTERDTSHSEFGNKTFMEYYEENERLANTVIKQKKKQQGEINVSTGTVEQKMLTVLAEVNRLNLMPEVRVYDKNDTELVKLSLGLTDILAKTAEIEKDDEKKYRRQLELLKQGSCFVQDLWVKDYRMEKELKDHNIGEVKGVSWTSKFKKAFEGPRRQVLYSPGVYLGNIREFDMHSQPFIFTFKRTTYEEAKKRYGGKKADGTDIWERWQYVPKSRVPILSDAIKSSKYGPFAFEQIEEGKLEEVHYQDEINNEYQIYLNGVPMLPYGFPLSAISPGGNFNIEKQTLQVINNFFAYGKSFVSRTSGQVDILDEILRLLILKTRKSIHPPYANISGKVISSQSLMPGRISMNVDPGALVPIGQEGQGPTASEFQMLREMRENIDKVTVSPQVQGQMGRSGTTAFEVSTLARQAQKMLSLIFLANTLMEQKLAYLRLDLVMGNYFKPVDTVLDEEVQLIKNVYQTVTRQVNIDGRGRGTRIIVPVDNEQEVPSSNELMDFEDFMGTPEAGDGRRRRTREELGMEPVESLVINVDKLRKTRLFFFVEIDARERDNSANARMQFREQLQDIAALASFGSRPNIGALEEEFAHAWGKRKDKLFDASQMSPQDMEQQMPGMSEIANQNLSGASTMGESVVGEAPEASI